MHTGYARPTEVFFYGEGGGAALDSWSYFITCKWVDILEDLRTESSLKPGPSFLSRTLPPSPYGNPDSDPDCNPSPSDGELDKSEEDFV